MDNPKKLRSAALVAALAAITATAWATSETFATTAATPVVATSERPVWTELEQPAAASEPVAVTDTLLPNETVVVEGETAAPAVAPAPQRSIAQAPITIEERRLSLDERIQADVMDRLAQNGNLSGRIGVTSQDAVVTLTGYTSTSGQAYRAGREARSVIGVKTVDNQIRPRIGGSV